MDGKKRRFTPHSVSDKRMMVLWLRFLTEIDANTQNAPSDLLNNPEISKALEEVKVSAFNEEELRAYDKFWDSVRVEKTLQHDSYQEGRAEGANDEKIATAKRMLSAGFTAKQVSIATSLPVADIEKLL